MDKWGERTQTKKKKKKIFCTSHPSLLALTVFYPLIYRVKKGPTLSVENLALFSITEQESRVYERNPWRTYSYGPKMKIKRGKGSMETTQIL